MGDENKYETKQFLDITDLESFWGKAKEYIDSADDHQYLIEQLYLMVQPVK